jgi:hypothetical protein
VRLSIIHLSDFHIHSGHSKIAELADPLINAVIAKRDSTDLTLVAVTGDVAFSGAAEEYKTAQQFFAILHARLAAAISPKPVWAFVPGNHDCNFIGSPAARSAVIKSLGAETPWDASIPTICTAVQSNYFEFVGNMGCSQGLDSINLVSEERIVAETHTIAVWGINSAWVSQLKEQPGSIYFPVDLLRERVESAQPALNILLLHHPFAWFRPEVRREFLRLVDSVFAITLGGHEHVAEAWGRDDFEGNKSLIVEGGVFQEKLDKLAGSSFNLVSVDLKTSEIEIVPHAFDGKRYVPGEILVAHFDNARQSIKPYRLLSDKCNSFLKSAGATFRHPAKQGALELQDIYVEPDFVDMDAARDIKSVEKNVSGKDLFAQINQQPYVVIGGAEKAGKSAWIRWAYLQLHHLGLTPVRIEGAQLREPDPKSLMKLISDEYRQQYAEQDSVAWEQLDFSSKALLIDDFDASNLNSESRKEVLSILTMRFGCVFITCDDALLMQAAGANSEFDGFKKYELPEFGHRLRDALIGKWLRIGRSTTLDHAAFQIIREQRARALNALLGQSFIPSRPIFLLTLLQSMEMGAQTTIRGSSLGEYYEYLIRHALLGASVEPQDLDAVLNYLTEMGYCLIEREHSHLDAAAVADFDANFAKRYLLNLKFDQLHKQLRDADILEEWNDQVRFKYRYVLLFFGARYLARHFGSESEVTRQVRAVARNIAIAKYADLMLFIVHHSNDPTVLDIVLEESDKVFRTLIPLRLDQADVAPINSLVLEIPRLALSDESAENRRERDLRRRDATLKKRQAQIDVDVSDLSLSSLQDNSTNDTLDYVQRMSHGLRLMGILGQVLRNYYGSLRAERKEQIASASYAMLGRILRSYFDLICRDKESLGEYVAQQLVEHGAQTQARARSFANRVVFGLASLFAFVMIKRTSEFLGSDKLLPTHEKVVATVDTPLSRLLGLAISLDYPSTGRSGAPRLVPVEVLRGLDDEFRNNPCAAWVLRRLVRDYLYMFEVSFKDKHKICETLGISIKSQQQIQLTSKRKRKT